MKSANAESLAAEAGLPNNPVPVLVTNLVVQVRVE